MCDDDGKIEYKGFRFCFLALVALVLYITKSELLI